MILDCINCGSPFETKCLLDNFCSVVCQVRYYKLPEEQRKIELTTSCPQCKKDYTRKVYLEDCRVYQGLTLCPDCQESLTVTLGKKWPAP